MLLLGDNPFFGVQHRSLRAAEEKARRFEDTEKILRVLRLAKNEGAAGFMLSSHERARGILSRARQDAALSRGFPVYAHVPYLMKMVSRVTQRGPAGALKDFLAGPSAAQNAGLLFSGALGWLRKDFRAMLAVLLERELSDYKNCEMGGVFLHNGLTDLALGLGLDEALLFFEETVRKKYGVAVGFGTLNFPALAQTLRRLGLKNSWIMAPFNPAGHGMNPGRDACEKEALSGDFRILAMNTLAQGSLSPREAFSYLARLGIRNAVVGASTPEHVTESFALARQMFGAAAAR